MAGREAGAAGPRRVRLVARVYGSVQGVGFRYATVRQAAAIGGLTGFVRNAEDGSVQVVAEGGEEGLRAFEAWLSDGPSGSVVRRVEAGYGPATGEWGAFDVRF
jgi:acylphosphatase